MSLSHLMFISSSAMENSSLAMRTVGDNLANLDTNAFKGSDVTFEDLLSTQLGISSPVSPNQVGTGAGLAAISPDLRQGDIIPTGRAADLAITGNGYFITRTPQGQTNYTRDGNFATGRTALTATSIQTRLTTRDNYTVQGWPIDVITGTVNTNAPPTDVVISTSTLRAAGQDGIPFPHEVVPENLGVVTRNVNLSLNLNAAATPPTDPTAFNYSTNVTTYDTNGIEQNISIGFRKTVANTWQWQQADSPANTGTLTFDTNGNLTGGQAGTIRIGNNPAIPINFGRVPDPNNSAISFSAGSTQIASDFNVTYLVQEGGFPNGSYRDFSVDDSGTIFANYTNGQRKPIYQIAMATFTNTAALQKNGKNYLEPTKQSGPAIIGSANTKGLGKITPTSLERSNVDATKEVTDMINYQRTYQLNSRIVSISDQLIQDTIQLKR